MQLIYKNEWWRNRRSAHFTHVFHSLASYIRKSASTLFWGHTWTQLSYHKVPKSPQNRQYRTKWRRALCRRFSRLLKRLLLTGANEMDKRDMMPLNYHKITKQRFLPANHDSSLVHDRKCRHFFQEIFAHPATCTVRPLLSWSAPRGGPLQREPHDSLLQPSNTDGPKHHQFWPQIKSYATEMRGSVFFF